jgi:3-hydroxyisobutyrate dehydrogenase-like beta-hydroxyacid dehydrogenase
MSAGVHVGLLGLGEAGAAIANDLVELRVEVSGWDPRDVEAPGGVQLVADPKDLAGADVILSVTSARAALAAATGVAPFLRAAMLYADLNSGSAALKRALAEVIGPTGALFADVALMATVPGNGLRTPALVSGPGAERFAQLFSALGMPVQAIGDEPGAAATRKLLRSVFTKGIAVTAIEALQAADAAHCRAWMWQDLVEILDNANEALLTRLVEGTALHAERRAHEMEDVSELLRELDVVPHMSEAAMRALREMASPV